VTELGQVDAHGGLHEQSDAQEVRGDEKDARNECVS
jgi:hypothetical protein